MKINYFFTNNKIELKAKPLAKDSKVLQNKCIDKITITTQEFTDYLNQVRMETIKQIRDLLEKKVPNGLYLSRAVLKKELDELEGE